MTKNNWIKIRIGTRVTTEYNDLFFDEIGECTAVKKTLVGSVSRINSNGSQVLVIWDSPNFERWYGRLGLEILN